MRLVLFVLSFLAVAVGIVGSLMMKTHSQGNNLTIDQAKLPNGFVARSFQAANGDTETYIVYKPIEDSEERSYPVILFLHGAGQTGKDRLAPIRGGLARAIQNSPSSFPCLVIFPQSHEGSWQAESRDGQRAMQILNDVKKNDSIDENRIYLTGYSMGGEGTWSLAGAYPEVFAGIVPICPGKNPATVDRIKNIPCWCFQGAQDTQALVQDTRTMMLAIQKAGGQALYHEYPNLEHNCWDQTYSNPEVIEWLLNQ